MASAHVLVHGQGPLVTARPHCLLVLDHEESSSSWEVPSQRALVLLQAEHAQLPRPVFTEELLQAPEHPGFPVITATSCIPVITTAQKQTGVPPGETLRGSSDSLNLRSLEC